MVCLNDLINFIDSGLYFNILSESVQEKTDESLEYLIPLPSEAISSEMRFVEHLIRTQKNTKQLRELQMAPEEKFSNMFHVYLNEHEIYDVFFTFQYDHRLELLKEWGQQNQIVYTVKKCPHNYNRVY